MPFKSLLVIKAFVDIASISLGIATIIFLWINWRWAILLFISWELVSRVVDSLEPIVKEAYGREH